MGLDWPRALDLVTPQATGDTGGCAAAVARIFDGEKEAKLIALACSDPDAAFRALMVAGLVVDTAMNATGLVMSFFVARWMGRKQNIGWKFQYGCSTGRHGLRLRFGSSAISSA